MALQDKTVKFTIPSKTAITLVENTIDNTSTTLGLPYQNDVNINRIVNNNLIHLLENFCSNTAPSPSIEGQLWLDTSDSDSKQELGRLKIYMNQTAGMQYVDVAGTVIDKNGQLRHTGPIEAFNDLNNIPENDNTFPEDADYYKFLTTKAHCDSNYLSGGYSSDNTIFVIRGNRYVTYTRELIFGKPFEPNDNHTLMQKKFVDMYYLFGNSNSNASFNIKADKKLYYENTIEMTSDFQLITKEKCDDKFAKTIAEVSNFAAKIKSTAEKIKKLANDPFDANDLAHSGAIAIANEVKRLVAARPKATAPTPATIGNVTGTVTVVPQGSTSLVGVTKAHIGLKWCRNPSAPVGTVTGADMDFKARGFDAAGNQLVSFYYGGVSGGTALVPGSSRTSVSNPGETSVYEDKKGYGWDGTKFYSIYEPTNTSKQFATFEACAENEACDLDLKQVDASIEYFIVIAISIDQTPFDQFYKCAISISDISNSSTSSPLTDVDLTTLISNEVDVGKIKRVSGGWTFEALI